MVPISSSPLGEPSFLPKQQQKMRRQRSVRTSEGVVGTSHMVYGFAPECFSQ